MRARIFLAPAAIANSLSGQLNSDSNARWYPGGPLISGASGPEGVAADAAGNVYGAEIGPRALRK